MNLEPSSSCKIVGELNSLIGKLSALKYLYLDLLFVSSNLKFRIYLNPLFLSKSSPSLLGADPIAIFLEIFEYYRIGIPVHSE